MGYSDSRPAVDSSVLDGMCKGDESLREELVRLFLADSQHQLRAAGDAVSHADPEELRVTSDALRLNAVNIGAGALAELGRKLHGVSELGDLGPASSLLSTFRAEFERVKEALRHPPSTPG